MAAIRLVSPGKNGQFINEFGILETPPTGWVFLPAGDAATTRKVTAKGDIWRVQIKKGRRIQSTGIWAPLQHINEAKAEVPLLTMRRKKPVPPNRVTKNRRITPLSLKRPSSST
jgi:hypothetical protein